jgi:hypothetical protein
MVVGSDRSALVLVSKSVLGSMNDLAYQIETDIAIAGGLERFELRMLHRRLNRIPLSSIEYRYAVDTYKQRLSQMEQEVV